MRQRSSQRRVQLVHVEQVAIEGARLFPGVRLGSAVADAAGISGDAIAANAHFEPCHHGRLGRENAPLLTLHQLTHAEGRRERR